VEKTLSLVSRSYPVASIWHLPPNPMRAVFAPSETAPRRIIQEAASSEAVIAL
jgi:hypothetical protein